MRVPEWLVTKASAHRHLIAATATVLVVAALPLTLTSFWLQTGLFAMAAAIGAIGLTLLVGVAGQLSLGHAFFIAVGAYGYAYLAGDQTAVGVGVARGLGWPPLAAILATVALAGLVGALISPISGRLRGIYLGIATLGLVFVGLHLLKNVDVVQPVSGGFNGRAVTPFSLFGVTADSLQKLWYLGLLTVVLAYWVAHNIKRHRPGRAMEAIRDGETIAAVMGVRVRPTKAAVFALSSMYAGLAGAILALTYRYIVPESFGFAYSIDFLAMVVVGGLGSIGGAVLGAGFVTALPLALNHFADVIPLVEPVGAAGFDAATTARVLYGIAMVAALMFLPDGLAGIRLHLRRRPPHQSVRQASGRHVRSTA